MFEDAERFLKEYVHAKPDDAEAWNSLGSCYESLKKYRACRDISAGPIFLFA